MPAQTQTSPAPEAPSVVELDERPKPPPPGAPTPDDPTTTPEHNQDNHDMIEQSNASVLSPVPHPIDSPNVPLAPMPVKPADASPSP